MQNRGGVEVHLADNMNLCRFHLSSPAVRTISEVEGVVRVSSEDI